MVSNVSLIPLELVDVEILFTRASMYGSQIRQSIFQSTSMAILAILEMLWEDVCHQLEILMTVFIG